MIARKISLSNKAVTKIQAIVIAAIVIVAAVGGTVAYSLLSNTSSSSPIKIGVVGPKTGSPAGEADLFLFKPIELAVNEINAAGGVLGRQLQLIEEDDAATAATTVSAATKLILDDKVSFILGPWGSDSCYAIQEVLNKYNVGAMTTSAGAIGITKNNGSAYFFRNYVFCAMEGVMMDYAAKKGVKQVAIVAISSTSGRERAASFQAVLQSYGIGNPYTEYFPTSETTFNSYVSRVVSSGADAVDLIGTEAGVFGLLKALAEAGWNKPIYTSIWSGSQVFLNTVGSYGEGVYGLSPYEPQLGDAPKFTQAYEAAYTGKVPGIYALASYEGVYLVANAIEKANSADPVKIVQALKSNEWQGDMFTYKFDNVNQAYPPVFVFQIVNGKHAILAQYKYTAIGGGNFTMSQVG